MINLVSHQDWDIKEQIQNKILMQIINNYTIACISFCVIEGFQYRMRYGMISLQASVSMPNVCLKSTEKTISRLVKLQ